MQLYARDITGKKCNVHSAKKGNDYFCLECNGRVRPRSGQLLRAHFFHIYDEMGCRQAGKTQEHIAIQRLIQQQIGAAYCQEEMRFATIGRVADVAWPERNLIFEVQCSPISAEEVQARNRDYASCGWDVVWVLYDKTFNQRRLSAAEKYLCGHTHYFSDVESIYDQVHIVQGATRHTYLEKRPIVLTAIKPLSFDERLPRLSHVLHKRFCTWLYCAEGDYLWSALFAGDACLNDADSSLKWQYLLYPIYRLLGALRAIWHVILERSCS